ncbi:MAG: FecR domain-containing protein [Sphingomonas bacterium]|nr:FecR domain-containing protein [Sphingomonas bacterium]
MSSDLSAELRAEAIAWRIRLRDGQAQEWDDFVGWLESDPRHVIAYDLVALHDIALDSTFADWARSPARTSNDNDAIDEQSPSTRRWLVGGIGVAAATMTLFIALPQSPPPTDYYVVATAPGQQRSVTLGGRDRVALNGATQVKFDRKNPRFASLVVGEAAFAIGHNVQNPFVVELGADRLLDVGTAFNIVRSSDGHKIEVSQGSVIYNPAKDRIALAAGQTLTSRTHARQIIIGRTPVSQVGGWQRGRLSYRSAPLVNVVADISRSIKTPVTVQSAIANRTFTGTIEIDRNESRMLSRVESLLGVAARRGESGWVLGPAEQRQR